MIIRVNIIIKMEIFLQEMGIFLQLYNSQEREVLLNLFRFYLLKVHLLKYI